MPDLPIDTNDVYSQFGVSPNDYTYDPSSNTIKRKELALPTELPTDLPVDPTTGNPIYADSSQASVAPAWLKKLTGTGGEERFQTWPERMVRSGSTIFGDVYSGAVPIESPTGYPGSVLPVEQPMEPNAFGKALGIGNFTIPAAGSEIARAQDAAGMAGMSTLGIKPGTASVGSGMVRKEYPIAPRNEWYGEANFENTGGVMKKMTPDEFLNESRSLKMDESSRENIDLLKQHILEGKTLDPLQLYKGGKEDGRHRAIAAKELGIEEVPVISFREDSKAGTAIGALNQSGMYSNLERVIANSKVQKATPEQWQSYLKNQPGVKPEELEFSLSNLPEGQITKEQLAAHVADNGIKLGEVWKGNPTREEKVKYLKDQGYGLQAIDELIAEGFGPKENTKYQSYQLPGGSDYRELLMTLPEKKGAKRLELEDLQNKINNGEFNSLSDAQRQQLFMRRDALRTEAIRDSGEPYKSSHWDEPNVLAHIRMNDREVPGVGKTLHVEEIQSDWHQAGRKEGYKDEAKAKELERQYSEIEKNHKTITELPEGFELIKDGDKWGVTTPGQVHARPYTRLYDSKEAAVAGALDKLNSTKMFEAKEPLMAEMEKHLNSVPNAPFKKTWDELALKRVLSEAVNKGYDAVSWTPGEAQAARYDLSKQISKLHLTKLANRDGQFLQAFDHKGNEVINKAINNPEKELPDIVGKEASQKLLDQESQNGIKKLEGQDLKVGGEGMKAFYDKMLVDKANALVKKMGGKVEYENLPGSKKVSNPAETYEILKNDAKYKDMSLRDFVDSFNKLNSEHQADLMYEAQSRSSNKIPIIKITPQMREQIKQKGFPLYSSGVPVFTPVDKSPFDEKNYRLVPVQGNPFE